MKKILAIGISALVLAFVGVSSVSAEVGYGGTPSGHRHPVVTSPSSGRVLGASTVTVRITSPLRRGVSSDSVKSLQERLRSEGYFTYPVSTGYFGPFTLAAVKLYQAAHGINPVTGFVGPLTIAELNK